VGIEKARSMLAPALFVLNLPVSLARAPGKIVFGSGGRVEDFCLRGRWSMQWWQSKGICFVGGGLNNNQWEQQC
jgi:hypothetical protein